MKILVFKNSHLCNESAGNQTDKTDKKLRLIF